MYEEKFNIMFAVLISAESLPKQNNIWYEFVIEKF